MVKQLEYTVLSDPGEEKNTSIIIFLSVGGLLSILLRYF